VGTQVFPTQSNQGTAPALLIKKHLPQENLSQQERFNRQKMKRANDFQILLLRQLRVKQSSTNPIDKFINSPVHYRRVSYSWASILWLATAVNFEQPTDFFFPRSQIVVPMGYG
jgi:hypothetical protein